METETVEAKQDAPVRRGRASKEDAAYTISFLDDKGAVHSRVPANVTAVQVTPAGGKAIPVNIKEFHATTLWQQVALASRSKLQVFLKDVTKNNLDQIPSLVEEFAKNAKDATLYIPKEGGGPGRAFDYDFWVAVVSKVADLKIKAGVPNVKPMSDAAKEAFRAKLESMTPDQRKAKQEDWNKDKTFRNAVVLVRAERVEAKLAQEGLDTEGEYDVLSDI